MLKKSTYFIILKASCAETGCAGILGKSAIFRSAWYAQSETKIRYVIACSSWVKIVQFPILVPGHVKDYFSAVITRDEGD